MKNVVAIGGGHGLSTILKGIKDINDINISAIVTVADDGGSTGRIRERYTIPAMGDIRTVMLAMSDSEPVMHDLMNYRFTGVDDSDISGHSLGNLILTALTNMSGSFDQAIRTASDFLKVNGKVIPSTLQYVTLFAKMEDGTIVEGEKNIPSDKQYIDEVFYKTEVKAKPEAVKLIENADLIIYGIGSLYTSILPNTIIKGISEALNNSKAKKVYFANCMTQVNETYNYDLKDHLDALSKHNTPVDIAIVHNNKIPPEIMERYLKRDAIEVVDNGNCKVEVRTYDLLNFDKGLVRHDPNKIKKVVEDLL